ncbi:MFS transporter [Acetobacter sp. P1H12_c]|uniref:MFS transporter n=1 Tax=Acetobacter sp. P1H12_c TaxID=2762621 RepID=UPI0035ABF60B
MKYAFKQRKWLVFLGVLLPINLLMSLDRNAFILVSPKINTIFHFSYLQSTILASSMIWIYALAQIPAGWFINRFKPHVVLFVACLAWSLSVFFFPFARNFSDFLLLIPICFCYDP